jgi:hypothetical protein
VSTCALHCQMIRQVRLPCFGPNSLKKSHDRLHVEAPFSS